MVVLTEGVRDLFRFRRLCGPVARVDHNLSMAGWLNPGVTVRPSPIQGQGLFATRAIAAGEVLTRPGRDRYTVMTDAEFREYIGTVDSWDAVAIGHGLHRVSLVPRQDEPANYANHGCAPNAKYTDDGLMATRDIAEGEEITVDYASLSAASWSMTCHCGADNCTGIVRGTI